MANHKSSIKRSRQDNKKRAANRSKESRVKTMVKAVRNAIETKDKKEAKTLLVSVQSMIAKLAKTGVFDKRTASRKVSRLSSQVAGL